jgi:O-antigen biosynthesis protein WbqV
MNISRKLLPPPAALAFIHDVMMAAAAFALSMYLRLADQIWDFVDPGFTIGWPVFVGSAIVSFATVNLYRGIWRYASMLDLFSLCKAVTMTVAIFVAVMFLINRMGGIPRSLPVISWFVLLGLLGGPRFAYRFFKDRRIARWLLDESKRRVPVLLVGAGDGADLFIRAMSSSAAPYRVVGVLDDKGRRVGREIRGIPVLADASDFTETVRRLNEKGERPQRLIVTKLANQIDGALLRRLFDQAEGLGMTLAQLPSLTEFKRTSTPDSLELRPIAVEDLLGRPQANLDLAAIRAFVAGKRVLITGAGGTIGSELTRQVAAFDPAKLVLLDSSEFNLYTIEMTVAETFATVSRRAYLADVCNRSRISQIFTAERPEIVFHAAALKHVPMVELNPSEGVLTNAVGTRNVADAAREVGSTAMVLISTDKAITPSSVMGASKRLAETYCQALDLLSYREGQNSGIRTTRFMTVRFGNVLGSTGSVVPLFERQLARGGPITVTHPEVTRYFMTTREAVMLVLQASAYGMNRPHEHGRIFVLEMGEPVKIVDVARQMIRLAGLQPDRDIRIEFIGLRPGEKLSETLFDKREPLLPTDAEGILAAVPRPMDYVLVRRHLDEFETFARAGNDERLLEMLRRVVPEYQGGAETGRGSAATNS